MKDDLFPFYKEREFTLNTTPERFATWLQKHVKAGLITPPGAKIHVGIVQFTPPPNIGPTARLKIHGYVERPDPEEDGACLRSHLPGLIQFELAPSLTREGVEVKAECHDPALMEYFDELLAKIERGATPTLTREDTGNKRFGEIPTRREHMDWDVFISHAWEDKEAFARPLAKALEEEGLRVWFDEFTLRVGDSLRRSIDHGLANSRYGVVILSPNFFAKEWPQKELDGLVAREIPGEKVILPIWHNITADQVREYSPTLADRYAVRSDLGLEHVVEELLRVIKPASEPARRLRFDNDKLGIQYSPEVAQKILRRREGERIKVNREDKPDQYFVHKGKLHYLDLGAAQVCAERIGPFKDLDPDQEFILDVQEIRGSPYNRLKMIEVLDRIEFEPEMVLIPTGEFLIGTREEDVGAIVQQYNFRRTHIEREVPQHKVFVEEFEIAKYPVTNAEFQRFVEDTGYRTQAEQNGRGKIWTGSTWEQVEGADWCHPQGPDSSLEGRMDHPVVQVSWYDAVAYCNWLSEKEGLTPCYSGKGKLIQCDFSANGYRLPREAEWEKAARGTDGREFPWGDEWDESKCNTANGGPGITTPVGQYSPHHGDSPYGVVDTAGNVWEWCDDWFQAYQGNAFPDEYYGDTSKKVLRGGSWKDHRVGARCAYREGDPPDHMDDRIGFRCAKSSPRGDYDTDLSQLADIPSARVTPPEPVHPPHHAPPQRAPYKPRRPVNWEKVGAIAQVISLIGLPIAVIAVLIALGAWLVPNAANWLFKTPTVTPTSSPTHTPAPTATLIRLAVSSLTPTPTITPTPTPDCRGVQVLYLELDLLTGIGQRKHPDEKGVIILAPPEIDGLQNLSGRAVFANLDIPSGCMCEWQGQTKEGVPLEELNGSTQDCSFSFRLPDQVTAMYLTLTIDEQYKLFTVKVQEQ